MNQLSLAVSFLLAASVAAQQDAAAPKSQDPWYADFDKAVAAAIEQKKDLLVDFTGSDWCGWCIKLHEEVFAHDSFLEGVQQHFVLVALDFPRGEEAKSRVPNPDRNKELLEKYGVRGFPTVLLMTPEGEVFGKTGYEPGGPAKYLASIEEKRSSGKQRIAEIKSLIDTHTKAKPGKEQEAAVATAVELLSGMDGEDIGVEKVAAIARHAVDGNDAGLVEKAVAALLKTGQADSAIDAKAIELDGKNEKGLYELAVHSQMMRVEDDASAKAFLASLDKLRELAVKDKEVHTRMLFNAMRWSHGPLEDLEGAKRYAEALKKHLEGTPEAEQFGPVIDRILGGK